MNGKRAKLKADKSKDFNHPFAGRSPTPGHDRWYKRRFNKRDRQTAKRDLEE
jgi:hypothetical protein